MASGQLPAGATTAAAAARMIWNARVDAGVTAFFMLAVLVIVADSLREWSLVLSGHKAAVSTEVPYEARDEERLALAGD